MNLTYKTHYTSSYRGNLSNWSDAEKEWCHALIESSEDFVEKELKQGWVDGFWVSNWQNGPFIVIKGRNWNSTVR